MSARVMTRRVNLHKVFVSYYHRDDQEYKESLVEYSDKHGIFVDRSVDTRDIADDLSDERIRETIRDNYLRDSTVTIVLVGTETKRRKHVDWEIYSSMYDGAVNRRSGIVVVNLPSTGCHYLYASHGEAEKRLYSDVSSWTPIDRAGHERRYPHMPDRLIDNLVAPEAKISVVPWERLNATTLRTVVELAFKDRESCQYDLRRRMRRANS